MAIVRYCKLGTMPAFVILRRRYKLRAGLKVEYREVDAEGEPYQGNRYQWHRGIIDRVQSDFFFMSR